jgi:hypothetical protein
MDALGAAPDEIRQPRRHIGRRLHWLRSEQLVAAADSPAQRLRRGAGDPPARRSPRRHAAREAAPRLGHECSPVS